MTGRTSPMRSLTARLIVGLTLGITVLWCLAAAFSVYASYHELNEASDRVLQETARRLLPLASDDALQHEDDDAEAIHRFGEEQTAYLSYQLRDRSGRIVLRSHDAPSEPFNEHAEPGLRTVGDYRLFTDTDDATGLTITVAETTQGRREVVHRSIAAMLWPLVGLIPLSVLVIWLVVRRTMIPVLRFSSEIAKRGSENLTPLDTSGQPDELRPIADAAARLLERLRAALDAERAFAANSAHELRTPIAGALAQTQRLIAELENDSDRKRARDLEATLKRLSSLAEKLMQLSRVDAGIAVGDSALDVVPILDIVVSDCAKRLVDPGRIHYQRPEGARLVVRIDVDAFAIAVRNLIDNALDHGRADGPVEVRLETDGEIRVINEGPAVAADTLAQLKHRFARGETRSAGAGLGLAIVETIMEQTGGTLALFSPVRGRADGFEASLIVGGIERQADQHRQPDAPSKPTAHHHQGPPAEAFAAGTSSKEPG